MQPLMRRLAIAILLLSMPEAFAAKPDTRPDERRVYKTIGGVQLHVDLFKPESVHPGDKRPAIVFFFGGGWLGGTPRQFHQHAEAFAELGFVAISAEYRVIRTHKTTPFECVADGKSVVRWIRQNAGELGVDPQRVVAAGGSAGGHVAACTALIKGHESPGDDLTISSVPDALILYNPVIDTTARGYGLKQVGEDRQTEISPCHHVRKKLPPTLVFHGTGDKTVPFENAERFTRLMKDAGNDCRLVPFPGAVHGFFNGSVFRPKSDNKYFDRTMEEAKTFVSNLGLLRDL